MKIIFVVDSIRDIKRKIAMMQTHFGNDIYYVVKGQFEKIFETYSKKPDAVYSRNLSKVIHVLLNRIGADSVVVYYSSLDINETLLNKFISTIGDGEKIVNVEPHYNVFERFGNSIYNTYVKSLFKLKDSLASVKLQYLPLALVEDLKSSHFANRMFEYDASLVKTIHVENKEMSKTLKTKRSFVSADLLPILIALVITLAWVINFAFFKIRYILVILYIALYVLDIFVSLLYSLKAKFDARFLK